jgi:predicted Zn-dependent peptidase
MSSRLFQQVREERGLCYSIFSFAQMFTDTGMFGVYAGTSDKTVDEMMEVSLTALKACQYDLSQEEIDRSKQQLRAAVLMRRDSVSSMMDVTARHLALYGRVFERDEMLAAIDKVSRNKVAELAEMIIAGPPPSLSVVGPAASEMQIRDMQAILA